MATSVAIPARTIKDLALAKQVQPKPQIQPQAQKQQPKPQQPPCATTKIYRASRAKQVPLDFFLRHERKITGIVVELQQFDLVVKVPGPPQKHIILLKHAVDWVEFDPSLMA